MKMISISDLKPNKDKLDKAKDKLLLHASHVVYMHSDEAKKVVGGEALTTLRLMAVDSLERVIRECCDEAD